MLSVECTAWVGPSGSPAAMSSLVMFMGAPVSMVTRHGLSPTHPWTIRLLLSLTATMLNGVRRGNGDADVPHFLSAPTHLPRVSHLFTLTPTHFPSIIHPFSMATGCFSSAGHLFSLAPICSSCVSHFIYSVSSHLQSRSSSSNSWGLSFRKLRVLHSAST
jgi:hypothetical protein